MELLYALEQSPALLLIVAFLFSLLVGSFLNVVIYRFPKSMEYQWTKDSVEYLSDTYKELQQPLAPFTKLEQAPSIIWARSHCQNCKHQIKAWENIPVLGFLFLRGKCSHCKTPISHRYWLIELLTALMSTFVVYHFGWSIQAVFALLLTWYLIAISMIDYDTMVIPDQFSLSLMWLGLLASLWMVFVDPATSIKGALLGYLLLWAVFHLFKLLTGKEGMGYGDFKLLAAGGAWFGMQSTVLIVIMSALAGSVIGGLFILLTKNNKDKHIPFGPYLAVGMWITMLYGEQIIQAYLRYSGLS